MKIKINSRTGGVITNGRTYKTGHIYEIERVDGDALISAGHAVEILPHGPAADARPERATAEPDAERAVKPEPKQRGRKRKGTGNGSEATDSGDK